MSSPSRAIAQHLPLTSVEFEIMLALADTARHGYAVMQEVERRTNGAVTLRPGSMYRAINRMLEIGFLEETTDRSAKKIDDHRRRYYRLTKFGRRVATAEAERLASAVNSATAKNLLHRKPA